MKLNRYAIFITLAAASLIARPTSALQPGRGQWLKSLDEVPPGLTATDWSSIRQQFEAHRHAAVSVEDGYQVRNPGQQWQIRFDGRGFRTWPVATQPESSDNATESWEWGLELCRYGFAGQECAVAGRATMSAEGQRINYDWDESLQEWFLNDWRGLEHGFTVKYRPAGAPSLDSQPSTLNFLLAVRGPLRPELHPSGRGVRFVTASGTTVLNYAGLTVFDADGRSLPARFELAGGGRSPHFAANELRLAIDERGARYPLTIDPVAQQAYVKASNTGSGDSFGVAVAVFGDTVIVGAHNEDSNATGVNGNQTENSAIDSGAAYIFVRSGITWSQQAYLKASNTGAGDHFGVSVAIHRDTVVVGAYFEDSNSIGVDGDETSNGAPEAGAAYVFVRDGTNWSQQAYLKASNSGIGDSFGTSVSVSGDTVVVGAVGQDGFSGAAYVFVRNGTTWTPQADLKASNMEAEDWFGASVAVSGETVIVGAYLEDSNAIGVNGNGTTNGIPNSGAAYIFVRNGTTWQQQAYLKAYNTDTNDYFGWSVALSDDTAVVGAPQEDSNAVGVNGNPNNNNAGNSGAAYVFVRNGTNWSQQAYLKASNAEANDKFGSSVAISRDRIIVGAPFEGSSSTGINGNQGNNSYVSAGAAYLFSRSGSIWSQLAYLKASNTDPNDSFGLSVAVAGDVAIVGAAGEASDATGVNGDQSRTNYPLAGAVYVFAGLGVGPRLLIVRDGTGGYFIRFNGIPGIVYGLQRASNATGPWVNITSGTAPSSGFVEFHDTSPPPARAFYRTTQP